MNLVALFEEALEFQNFNGSVLSNGKVRVFFIGRTSLADIYNDVAGEYPSENPKILDNLGMGPIYVNPAFDYEIVVYDEYDNELFSVKKYLHSNGAHSTSNVEVVPSENIQVSAWTQGDVQVYMPYITGNLGKVYSGVEPIVVNNDEDKISANHVPLGVQEPLFFVQDDENACIIGCSAQTEIPSSVSSKWEDASDTVSNNSAQWNIGTVYTAGNYIDINDDIISVTGLQPAGDYAYNSAVSSKLDTTAFSTVSGNFLTTGDSAQFYTNDNPSGFITGVDLSDYATTGDLANKLDTTAFSNVSGDFITALPEDLVYTGDLSNYATKDFVNDSIDSATSGLLPTSSFSSVSGNFLTALPSDLVYTADITGLATTGDLANKLDTTAFSTVSGDFLTAHQDISNLMPKSESANFYPMTGNPSGFLTAHQDLSDYQTIEGMTAYQEAGEYYSASNPSGFITGVDLTPYQTIAGMTAYQPAGDYLTTADSAQFITALPADLVYTADITGFATTADLTSKLDKSDSANFYTTANESGFITGIPDEVTNAASTVASNSANWNSTYNTVSTNSASWTGGDTELSSYVPYSALEVPLGTNNTARYTGFAQGVHNYAAYRSFAQGTDNRSIDWSFAQGSKCSAGQYSIAQGVNNSAYMNSQAFGVGIKIANTGMAIGEYNKTISGVSFVVGNGNSTGNRSDAFIIYPNGSVSAAGKISANGVELGAGGSVPDEVTAAASAVSSNSANWNSTYNTVSTNSADWSVSEEISGTNGIKISESADKVIIEVSADYYLASNPSGFITGINYNTGSI